MQQSTLTLKLLAVEVSLFSSLCILASCWLAWGDLLSKEAIESGEKSQPKLKLKQIYDVAFTAPSDGQNRSLRLCRDDELATAHAAILIYDDVTKKWNPRTYDRLEMQVLKQTSSGACRLVAWQEKDQQRVSASFHNEERYHNERAKRSKLEMQRNHRS